jgi:hypothetical protein
MENQLFNLINDLNNSLPNFKAKDNNNILLEKDKEIECYNEGNDSLLNNSDFKVIKNLDLNEKIIYIIKI